MDLLAAAPAFDPPAWAAAPFVALLLAVAALPVAAPHFWHRHRSQAIVAALFGLPVAAWEGPRPEGVSVIRVGSFQAAEAQKASH